MGGGYSKRMRLEEGEGKLSNDGGEKGRKGENGKKKRKQRELMRVGRRKEKKKREEWRREERREVNEWRGKGEGGKEKKKGIEVNVILFFTFARACGQIYEGEGECVHISILKNELCMFMHMFTNS